MNSKNSFVNALRIQSLVQAIIIAVVGTSYNLFLLIGSTINLDQILSKIMALLLFNYIFFAVAFCI